MLELFKVEGYEFLFITSRGLLKRETKEAVKKVFEKNSIPTDNIYWGIKDKLTECKNLGIYLMIDDNPDTCKLLRDNKITTLYFRDKNNEYLVEVSNIGEICRYIFTLNGFKNSQETYEKIVKKKEGI